MARLHVALVTPLTGPLGLFRTTCATALTIWAKSAVNLPSPWTDIELDVWDTGSNTGAAIQAALEKRPDVLGHMEVPQRRVVWPPEQAERPLLFPLTK